MSDHDIVRTHTYILDLSFTPKGVAILAAVWVAGFVAGLLF